MTEKRYAVGVDLGGTSVKLGIVSEEGELLKKAAVDTKANEGPEAVIKQIKKGLDLLLEDEEYNLVGIGIGAPGAVNPSDGHVYDPPNLPGWTKIPLGTIIQEYSNINTIVENDANVAAVGELIFGAGRDYNNFLMVTLGTGVGGGIIFNRQVFHGDTGAAGEIGHLTIVKNGRKCNCGNTGCIEAYCGNNHLVNIVKDQLHQHPNTILYKKVFDERRPLTPKLIHDGAEEGCQFCNDIIKNLGSDLGTALASVINVLDISTIIIGGGVSGFGERLFTAIKDEINKRALKTIADRTKILQAQLKNEAGIIGASALVFN